MILMGLVGNSAAVSAAAKDARHETNAARRSRAGLPNFIIGVMLVCVDMFVWHFGMAVVVVVHQFLRHVREHLARGGRGAAGPLDAALLARGLEDVFPRELRGIARDFEALGQRGEHELADAAAIPAFAK